MRGVWRGFRTESVADYTGVLVPLEEAHLHGHSARSGRTEFEEAAPEPDDDAASDDGDNFKDRENEGTGMLEMSAAEYSIEGLRKEVRRGGKGRWTDYESEFLFGGWMSRFKTLSGSG